MLNCAIIMGRLTAEPELKTTNSNLSVCSFSVAVDRSFSKEKQTDFINVVAWRQTADFVSRYFHKGQMIAVQGSIQTRNYTDKNGNKRTAFEVVASEVSFCGSKAESGGFQSDNAQSAAPAAYQNGGSEDFSDIAPAEDDLPF